MPPSPSACLLAAPAPLNGLSRSEAAIRLERDGFNELPSARPRAFFAMAWQVVREPMFLLLISSGAIYLFLGNPIEALALLAAVFMIIGITLYQERRTDRALQALRDLSSPRAVVIRDGVQMRIESRDVVRGDLVVLREGDRVPADGLVQSCSNLLVDESLLTGESVPVRKTSEAASRRPFEAAGGDDRPSVYSGTLVVRGDGTAIVSAIGSATEMGKIGAALNRVEVGRTGLQEEVSRLVRWLASIGIGMCLVVGIAYTLSRHHWLDGALAGLTLAISMIPEEFPVVLTVFLALGAWRISRSHVLARRIPTIETLGAATVLCVDKTGTLTLNQMSVAAVAPAGNDEEPVSEQTPLTPASRRLISTASLASKPDAIDPMERAFNDLAQSADTGGRAQKGELEREYPLSEARLAVVHAWRNPGEPHAFIAAKGAPEAIITLCHLDNRRREEVLRQADRMANEGLRVLGVASGTRRLSVLPDAPEAFGLEYGGLVGLADPVRPGVRSAIAECHSARIRVVMITGDYPTTARSIARQIGFGRPKGCLTGGELARMNDEELGRAVQDVDVFARIAPDQKLRLVNALQASGEVVAMTGDGVNDAPALKAADIGIAMGNRGTDVSREAAALVLLDDDFSSIVRAVRLGRRIYDNIEKAMAYVLSIHVPIAGLSMLPVFLGWPLILMPVHVAFFELVTDPACSIAFEMEPEEADVMTRPPRNPKRRLLTRALIVQALLQGMGAFCAVVVVLAASVSLGQTEAERRALAFSTLILTTLALIAANRSLTRRAWGSSVPNHGLRWIAGGAIAMLAVILSVPFMRQLFQLAAPSTVGAVIVVLAASGALVWMEAVKRAMPHQQPTDPAIVDA